MVHSAARELTVVSIVPSEYEMGYDIHARVVCLYLTHGRCASTR